MQTPMNKLSSFSFFHCKVSSGARLLWGKPPPTHIGKCILVHKHTHTGTCARNCSPTQRSIAAPHHQHMHHCKCLPTHGAASHCGTRMQSARHVHAMRQYKTGCFFSFSVSASLPLSLPLSLLYFKKIQTFCWTSHDFSTWEAGARIRSAGGSRVKRGSRQQRRAEFINATQR